METQDKYAKLKELLDANKKWPLKYMFKFIIPNKDGKVDAVKALLPVNGVNKFKHTTSLKYVSLTCVAYMKSTSDIIALTESVQNVPGVMSL